MLRPPPTSILFPYTTLFRSLSNIYKEELVHHFDTLEKEMDLEMPNDKQIVLTIRNVLKKKNRITESKDNEEMYYLYISRSEEHTSELQSRGHLVCRLLLEKKNKKQEKIRL